MSDPRRDGLIRDQFGDERRTEITRQQRRY